MERFSASQLENKESKKEFPLLSKLKAIIGTFMLGLEVYNPFHRDTKPSQISNTPLTVNSANVINSASENQFTHVEQVKPFEQIKPFHMENPFLLETSNEILADKHLDS